MNAKKEEKEKVQDATDYQIGCLLRDIRRKYKFQQEQVAHGLYSRANYSKMEQGMLDPDKFSLNVLFERMGVSVNLLGTNYTVVEYLTFEMRNRIIENLRNGEWEAAGGKLAGYEEWVLENRQELRKEKLQFQFIRYTQAVIRMEQGKQEDQKEELLVAIRLTVPDFDLRAPEYWLYGEQELALLILLAENEYRQGRMEEGILLYRKLLCHMEEKIPDTMECCRLYPEMVLSLAEKLEEQGKYSELSVCEKGIALLQKAHRLNGMEGLLTLAAKGMELCSAKMDPAKDWLKRTESRSVFYRTEAVQLQKLEKRIGKKKQSGNYPLLKSTSRGQLLGERILRLRKIRNMTQEQVCEGICEPESLSRIERGESKPSASRYQKLMKRLGMEECRYYPSIRSDRYDLYLALAEFEEQFAGRNYGKAEQELNKLEEGLDRRNVVNQQIISKNRIAIESVFNRISREEELELLWQALYLTVSEGTDISLWPLNQTEVQILNRISLALEAIGRRSEAIELLMKVKKRYEFSIDSMVKFRKNQNEKMEREELWRYRNEGMRPEYNAMPYLLTEQNLIHYFGGEGRHEEALRMAEASLKLAYQEWNSDIISNLLYEIAWNTDQWMRKRQENMDTITEVCAPLFYQSLLIAAISKQTRNLDFFPKGWEYI